MVRTSDFQFENVGSIPSNPNIKNLYLINKKNEKLTKNKIKFKFIFTSLTSPQIIPHLKFFPINDLYYNNKNLIKQSYILLTWFHYLSFIQISSNNKKLLKITTLPTSKKKFTLTKAPMAHKNRSKEQYKFQFHKFKIIFDNFFKDDNGVDKINKSIMFIFILKNSFPQFETNLLFLKTVNISFFIKDLNYFNYYKFLNK